MFDTPTLLLRLADFHLGAMLLLSATLVAGYFLGQPARRLTLAWSAAVAIAVLGMLCCVPDWSMLHVFRAEAQQGTASWPSDFEKSLSQAATGFQAAPTENFQAAPSTSPSAEIIVKSPAASFNFDPTIAAITVGTIGTLLCSVWLIAGALSAKRIIRAATPAGERLQNLLREVAGEGTLPRLLVSDCLSVAAAIGLWRPAILLPVSIDATATDEDMRGLLAHELAHVRNGDLRLLALWRLLLVALWINPLYWLLRRRMRLDQETLADAVAAEQTNRQEYAKRLVGWAREMSTGPGHPRLAGAAGLWENPSQLRRRIAVLLDERFTLLRQCSRRWRAACLLAAGSLAVAVSLVTLSPAEPTEAAVEKPKADFLPDAKAIANLVTQQEMLTLPVRVVNEEGEPVEGAKVTPWALRSSQGHSGWLKKRKDSKSKQKDPVAVATDADGLAEIHYPLHVIPSEKVVTTKVTLRINHPEYGSISSLEIAVDARLEESPYSIELVRGIPLEVKPTINSEPADLENIYAIYTGGRAGKIERTPEGTLRIPTMKPGPAKVRLVRIEGEKATHFSPILSVDLKKGSPALLSTSLLPAQTIHGVLDENVPRPIQNGRVSIGGLPQEHNGFYGWITWAPIQPDGSFTIGSWPAGEALQVIALCDGFHATSGTAPSIVKNARATSQLRPQVFEHVVGDDPIEIAMTPLVECVIDVVNQEGKPLADIGVNSSPNVGWWNAGAQIYCEQLIHVEKAIRTRHRDDKSALDTNYTLPFGGKTDAKGRVILHIPAGRRYLSAGGKGYGMPILLGSRHHRIQLTVGETTNVLIKLQPAGTESLGDWDKLAGVVFGCSTREGKRICALPGVQKKMDALRKRMREADNPRNPALLAEAYTAIAEALDGAGDAEEATKWRVKAAEQAGKREEKFESQAKKPETMQTAPYTHQHSIHVRVVDEAGDPIEKAWIGLKLGLARYEEERVAFNDVYPTDAGGWCTLPIGEERWGSVWVRAKGYALLPPLDILNNQRIRELDGKSLTLKKAEGFELEVFNSHSGRVSIEMIHPTDELTQFWIPDDWSGVYSRRIDDYTIGSNVIQLLPDEENRRVHIPGIAPENVDQFLIAGGSGNVRFDRNFFWSLKQIDGFNSVKKLEELGHKRLSESKYRITLPDAGKVRGRVVVSEDGAPLSRPFQLESHPTGAIGYYGVATVTPDEQGQFEIKRLADGYLKAAFNHKPDEPWRWSISPDLGVRAGTTTELLVTLERGRLLRGTVPLSPRTGDSINQPSIIEFNWGDKNQFGTITRTGREEGVYSAYVPTGKVQIRASLGPHNRQLQPKFFIQTEITVPEGEGEFIVPTPDADEISEDQPSNGWHVLSKGWEG